MAPSEQLTSSALQAQLQDGSLAGSWTLDPAKSEILLKSRHNWGLSPVHGVFREASGGGTITPAGDVSGVIAVVAASVDTKNPRRDKHLRSADFFDIDNHPEFTFTADSASPAGDGVRITGNLTVRGSTRPATFDAKVALAGDELQLDGEIHVNRADHGLKWNFIGVASMHSTIVVHAVFTRP